MGLPQRPHCPWSGADGDQETWGLGASTALVLEPSRGPRSSPYPAARGGRGYVLMAAPWGWGLVQLGFELEANAEARFCFSVFCTSCQVYCLPPVFLVNHLGGGRLASIDF